MKHNLQVFYFLLSWVFFGCFNVGCVQLSLQGSVCLNEPFDYEAPEYFVGYYGTFSITETRDYSEEFAPLKDLGELDLTIDDFSFNRMDGGTWDFLSSLEIYLDGNYFGEAIDGFETDSLKLEAHIESHKLEKLLTQESLPVTIKATGIAPEEPIFGEMELCLSATTNGYFEP